MRHRRSRRRHHRHSGFGRHFHLRHNPVGEAVTRGDHIKRALLGTVIVGGIATVTVVALDAAIAAFAPATMTNNMKNGAKILVAGIAAVGLGALKVPTSIVSGVAIGAVMDGLLGFYNTYVASSVAAAVAPAPAATAAVAMALAGGGPPAGQAAGTFTSSVGTVWTSTTGGMAAVPAGMQYVTDATTGLTWYAPATANAARQALPAGLPSQYAPVNARACPVPARIHR